MVDLQRSGTRWARAANRSLESESQGGRGCLPSGARSGGSGTRGILAPDAAGHPILRGIKDGDIFGTTDVYGVRLPLPGDSTPLVMGQVLKGMKFSDDPEETVLNAMAYLKRREWCTKGTWLVVITNALAHDKIIDTLQLRQIE